MQFEHAVAAELHMTVARMHDEMDCVELSRWANWYQQKHAKEKAAMEKAKRGRR